MSLAWFASLLLVGLTAGIFLATQLGQVRVQNTLLAREFISSSEASSSPSDG